MHNYCEWVEEYHSKINSNQLFVVLIDTDLTRQFNELKEKYEHIKNILIVDHVEFQEYLKNFYRKKNEEKLQNLYSNYGYDILEYLKTSANI